MNSLDMSGEFFFSGETTVNVDIPGTTDVQASLRYSASKLLSSSSLAFRTAAVFRSSPLRSVERTSWDNSSILRSTMFLPAPLANQKRSPASAPLARLMVWTL